MELEDVTYEVWATYKHGRPPSLVAERGERDALTLAKEMRRAFPHGVEYVVMRAVTTRTKVS